MSTHVFPVPLGFLVMTIINVWTAILLAALPLVAASGDQQLKQSCLLIYSESSQIITRDGKELKPVEEGGKREILVDDCVGLRIKSGRVVAIVEVDTNHFVHIKLDQGSILTPEKLSGRVKEKPSHGLLDELADLAAVLRIGGEGKRHGGERGSDEDSISSFLSNAFGGSIIFPLTGVLQVPLTRLQLFAVFFELSY
jgi:hypothetical protein